MAPFWSAEPAPCSEVARGISLLAQATQTNRLTPHPGPLPFEGRGSATNDPWVSNLVSRVRGIRLGAVSKGGVVSSTNKRVGRHAFSP